MKTTFYVYGIKVVRGKYGCKIFTRDYEQMRLIVNYLENEGISIKE
jgi:hypothetical protein